MGILQQAAKQRGYSQLGKEKELRTKALVNRSTEIGLPEQPN